MGPPFMYQETHFSVNIQKLHKNNAAFIRKNGIALKETTL